MNKKEVKGFTKAPAWLKKKYRESVKFNCQECHKNEQVVGILTPHRLKRGNLGGLYTLAPLNSKGSNVKIVCNSCHKKFHQLEKGCGK